MQGIELNIVEESYVVLTGGLVYKVFRVRGNDVRMT